MFHLSEKWGKAMEEHDASRREFVKKAAYVAPAILTLQAAPAYVKAGSIKKVEKIKDKVRDIIKEIKRHSFYLKPGEKKRVKEALARKRSRKKARKEQD